VKNVRGRNESAFLQHTTYAVPSPSGKVKEAKRAVEVRNVNTPSQTYTVVLAQQSKIATAQKHLNTNTSSAISRYRLGASEGTEGKYPGFDARSRSAFAASACRFFNNLCW